MNRKPDTSLSDSAVIPFEMITMQSLGAFMLFGGIDQATSYEACEFIIKANLLKQGGDPLTFIINSEGGSVNDGFAIIDVMETSRLPIHTVGTGLIASMALLISSAGHKGTRTLTKNTEIMAHQWMGGMEGKFHELMAVTNEHLRLKQLFVQHFLRHSTMAEKQINDVLFAPSDRWLSPKECKKYGLCDQITEYLEVPNFVRPAPVEKKKKKKKKDKDAQIVWTSGDVDASVDGA
jgi:ATP-dependent Clp protease protease subunit